MSPFWAGSLASLLAGLATCLGALPALGLRQPTDRQQNILLGFAAGVMLAASFFSLIIPGLVQAETLGHSRSAAAAIVVTAVLIGGLGLGWLGKVLPRADMFAERLRDERERRLWLFIAAITLHNFPEGMAVAVSFGGGDFEAGFATMTGIGLQNIPEGLAVLGAALSLGFSRSRALLITCASGLAEPVAGIAAAAAVALAGELLPWGLGIAAGAMVYIVAAEIIPDVQKTSEDRSAMTALMIGLGVMIFLDVTLG